MDRKRNCGTCAWWDPAPHERLADDYGICCFENNDNAKHANSFCRNHSFTRGWSEDRAPMLVPHLEFKATTPDQEELLQLITETWRTYQSYLDDWHLMKDK